MGRVSFVVWDGGGNVPPAVSMGIRLVAAGHEVEGYGPASLAGRFAREGLGYTVRDAADPWDVTAMAVDVGAHLRRSAPDVAVVDYMLPGALCGAEASGAATVAYVHTLYAALLGDGDHPSPMGMAATIDQVATAREAIGLQPVGTMGALLDRAERVLVTSPAELDAPLEAPSGNLRYVGPAFDPAEADDGWEPPPGDGPLVVVSLSTTPMDEAPVLQAIVDGLAGEPVRVVAMRGVHLGPDAVRVAANATRTGYVRHSAVLPHADVVVNHGGLGTTLATLAHGLPMVCVPLGRDQPYNAAAVARIGAGVVVSPSASPAEIGAAVADVLADDAAHAAAQQMATVIGGPSAGDRAAAEIAALVTA